MTRDPVIRGIRLGGQLLHMLVLALGLAGGYFMTVQSIRLELAAKAEAVTVETLERKLTNLEVILREGTVTREQFYEFSREVERRLARIEYYVSEDKGGHDGGTK
ncbi:MAG: hypothetical protein RBT76_10940 [candidate division Zixibacteria bacterium]|jgi:hypothetical protein|nr:hypothetical protein [candidate division Zixibacteria bacterium]